MRFSELFRPLVLFLVMASALSQALVIYAQGHESPCQDNAVSLFGGRQLFKLETAGQIPEAKGTWINRQGSRLAPRLELESVGLVADIAASLTGGIRERTSVPDLLSDMHRGWNHACLFGGIGRATIESRPSSSLERGTATYSYFPPLIESIRSNYPFETQLKHRLGRARARQVARSMELYRLFTGSHPGALKDLAKPAEKLDPDVFWPKGGFVLREGILKDPWGRPFALRTEEKSVRIVSLGADGEEGGDDEDKDILVEVAGVLRRPVGAPTERLEKYYTARVQIHLIAASIRAYRDTYGKLPREKSDLWEKPEGVEVWPDEGWLPEGKVPEDPWGEPYRIISFEGSVRVQVDDPEGRGLTPETLTKEERQTLEEIARPRFTEEEKKELAGLVELLSDDDLAVRERTEDSLKGWGSAIVPLLEERRKTEKNEEALKRLDSILASIPEQSPAWSSELAPLALTLSQEGEPTTPRELVPPAPTSLSFVDFDRLEIGLRGSILVFSDDFEADPEAGGGVYLRAPMPWISRDLLGLSEDDVGIFADLTMSVIDRDLTPEPKNPDDTLFFAGAGLDYTIVEDDTFLLRVQISFQYVNFGGVTDLDDGFAFRPGVLAGLRLADWLSVTVNPEVGFSDAGARIIFGHAGLIIRF